jgi:hypothetical protein
MRSLVDQGMFALMTDGLKTEEGAGKRERRKLWAGREAIGYTLFELRGSWHFRLRKTTTRRRRTVAEEDNEKNILSVGGMGWSTETSSRKELWVRLRLRRSQENGNAKDARETKEETEDVAFSLDGALPLEVRRKSMTSLCLSDDHHTGYHDTRLPMRRGIIDRLSPPVRAELTPTCSLR